MSSFGNFRREKLEIFVNEMMADDGPLAMVLMTQNDFDTSIDMSREHVFAL